MRLATQDSIPPGTYVHLKCKEHGLSGRAGVKHCNRERNGYQIGLEFSGFRWQVPEEAL
jgi:hypothetical protein